ncbi:MAG TPA: methionine--tRNA ligase [Chloroflexota bacterium]|nr:methionine--tRNA ligase [Chloroflexota bacterium]
MAERILVCVAWPYANGSLHVGHIAGAYLPADIFARFHRLRGNHVLMVSGSDEHGTPVTVRAEQEGVSPKEIADRYHREFLDTWQRLGISFDLFTRTGTDNHRAVVWDLFRTLLDRGHLFRATMLAPYSPSLQRFLADRYVRGTCPYCGYTDARGDQCESCGRLLDPADLLQMRSSLDGKPVELRETEHFFLNLPAFQEQLYAWVQAQEHWRPQVRNFTLGFLQQGLQPRAITRDIDWGVPLPFPGYEHKRIYVWFEACIGYLSATVEWARHRGDPEGWRPWWQDPATRSYYFIGKDNIPFHTIIWPAMLLGYGGLNLPYDVPANEYMNLEGQKISTSRGWAIWVPELLARFDPDAVRYMIAANLPETRDTDFSMEEFFRRNNDELVATYGNLAHRTLTFIQRYYAGRVPEAPAEPAPDPAIAERVATTFDTVAAGLAAARFKEPLREIMALAQYANRYFDEQAPWRQVREDRAACAATLRNLLYVIDGLKVLFYPYLPHSSARLHALLGYDDAVTAQGWAARVPTPGRPLPPPQPLFAKLDPAAV